MPRPAPVSPRERGFAFLETVVAAAILAGTLGVTWQAVESAARTERLSAERRQAILVAQSALAQIGTSVRLTVGSTSGRDGDFEWRADSEPYIGENRDGPPLVAVRVRVRLSGTGGVLADLQTLRFL